MGTTKKDDQELPADQQRRIWERIQAVAKRWPPVHSTVLLDDGDDTHGFNKTAAASSPPSAKGSSKRSGKKAEDSQQANGVLASILGYGEEDEEEDAEAQEEGSSSEAPGSKAEDADAMDAELAKFMQQLESDGLLKDQPADATASSDSAGTPHAPAAQRAQPEQPQGPSAQHAQPEQPQALSDGSEDTGAQEEAEQHVLGYLRGEPQWCKCLDASSGLPYYWHLETNEVVWDVPEGLDGEDLIPAETATETEESVLEAGKVSAVADAQRTATAPGPEAAAAGPSAPADTATPSTASGSAPAGAAVTGAVTAGNRVRSVVEALQSVAQGATKSAQFFLARMPAIVRLALEAQVQLAALQAAAHGGASGTVEQEAAADPGGCWLRYLGHVQQTAGRLQAALPAAVAAAEQLQEQNHAGAAAARIGDEPASTAAAEQPAASTGGAAAAAAGAAGGREEPEDGELALEAEPAAASTAQRAAAASGSSSRHSTADTAPHPVKADKPARSRQVLPDSYTQSAHGAYDWGAHGAYNAAYAAAYPAGYAGSAYSLYPYSSYYGSHPTYAYHSVTDNSAAAPPLPDEPPPLPPSSPSHTASAIDDDVPPGETPLPRQPPNMPGASSAPPLPPGEDESSSDMETEELPAACTPADTSNTTTVSRPEVFSVLQPGTTGAATSVVSQPAGDVYTAAAPVRRKEYVAAPVRTTTPPLHGDAAGLSGVSSDSAVGRAQSPVPGMAVAESAAVGGKRKASSSGAPEKSKKSKSDGGLKLTGSNKKVGALVSQWVSVKRTLAEEEERQAQQEAEALDPEALERKRRQEAEAWLQQQHATGAAQEAANANFAPVQGDWRKTLAAQLGPGAGLSDPHLAGSSSSKKHKSSHKHSKKDKDKERDKSTRSAGSSKVGPPKPTTLAEASAGLPIGWKAIVDKDTGDFYWENPSTKEVSWTKP